MSRDFQPWAPDKQPKMSFQILKYEVSLPAAQCNRELK
jgi:hypothetical protein